MQHKLTISEQTAPLWKRVIIISLLATILLAVLVVWSEGPLWTGIWRMAAFAAFAVLVLAYLQTRGKDKKIKLEFTEDHLVIGYFNETNKVQEELFELKTIKQVNRIDGPFLWGVLPAKNTSKFIIRFTDTSNALSLFRIEGRDLLISIDDAQKAEQFLSQKMHVDATA